MMVIKNLSIKLIFLLLLCVVWIVYSATATDEVRTLHRKYPHHPKYLHNRRPHQSHPYNPKYKHHQRKGPHHRRYLNPHRPKYLNNRRPHPYRPKYTRHPYHPRHHKPHQPHTGHPCERKCRHGDRRTCVYRWNVHLARVMGMECGKCPDVIEDCLKNRCITAGGDRRALYIVNFSFPGPTISVCKNDKIVVFLRNRLDQSKSVTIHWHGIHQRGTQWMDGVPMVTQCPIPGSTFFRYEFIAYPQGTQYWHAHSGFLSSDGIAGPLIVREPEDPHLIRNHYDEDRCNEHVLFLQEWMPVMTQSKYTETHKMHADRRGNQHVSPRRLRRRKSMSSKEQWFVDNFIASKKASKAMNEAMRPIETILINGRSSSQTNELPISVFNVTYGRRYRFRTIFHGITNCPLTLSIDRHNVEVIALDGQPIKRIPGVGKIIFQAGERTDFVLTANQEIGNYWIHAAASIDCEGLFGLAVLHYNGAPRVPFHGVPDPVIETSNKTFNVFKGRSDENNIFVSDAVSLFRHKRTENPERLFIRSDLTRLPDFPNHKLDDPHWWPLHSRLVNGHRYLPLLEGRSYQPSSSPLLSQQPQVPFSEFCGHRSFRNCPPKFCKCVNVKNVPYKRIIDMIIYDVWSYFPLSHPIHLHGYAFQVLQSGILSKHNTQKRVESQLNNARLNARSEIAPFKDTVSIPAGGYVVLRFYSDNPGPWLLHCHVAFHFENGMALVVRVGKFSQWPRVPKNFPKCGNFK